MFLIMYGFFIYLLTFGVYLLGSIYDRGLLHVICVCSFLIIWHFPEEYPVNIIKYCRCDI
jgi:hypothetical protein